MIRFFLIAALLGGIAFQANANEPALNAKPDLVCPPKPLKSFIEREWACYRWRGERRLAQEHAPDAKPLAEIQSKLTSLKCPQLDADKERLAKKYAKNAEYLRMLDDFSGYVAAYPVAQAHWKESLTLYCATEKGSH